MSKRIYHPSTGKVVNLYSTSQTAPVSDGAKLLLYTWNNNNDQKFEMEYVGDSVIMRIARDTRKVINRHSTTNDAHIWTYSGTTANKQDSLIDTRTVNGNTRIILVGRNMYLTKKADSNYLYWTTTQYTDGRQFFKIEEVSGGGGTSNYGARWPLSSKSSYPINSDFRTSSRPTHDGVDMAAPLGTPIYAIYAGKVSKVTTTATNPSEGISVRLDHDFGSGKTYRYLRSYYLHMQKANVSAGASVKQGDIIGYVNNTGSSQGNHLHLGIRYKTSAFTTGGDFYEGVDFIDPKIILP